MNERIKNVWDSLDEKTKDRLAGLFCIATAGLIGIMIIDYAIDRDHKICSYVCVQSKTWAPITPVLEEGK